MSFGELRNRILKYVDDYVDTVGQLPTTGDAVANIFEIISEAEKDFPLLTGDFKKLSDVEALRFFIDGTCEWFVKWFVKRNE